jgi:predicted DCC family thiol-disulfide oxidoreductase YuxK
MTNLLIFDGDCGFCTRSRDFLAKIDHEDRITLLPLQAPNAWELTGRSREQLKESLYWIGADGTRASGAEAVNAALSVAIDNPLPADVYRMIPGMRALQEHIYRWVAAHRATLPGRTPWCSEHPEDCVPTSR